MRSEEFESERIVNNIKYKFRCYKYTINTGTRWGIGCRAYSINSGDDVGFRGIEQNEKEWLKIIDLKNQTEIEDHMIEKIRPVLKRKITNLKKKINLLSSQLTDLETQF